MTGPLSGFFVRSQVPSTSDLPFFPFRIHLAFYTPSTTVEHRRKFTSEKKTLQVRQEPGIEDDFQHDEFLANPVTAAAVWSGSRKEDLRHLRGKRQFPHAPTGAGPPEPVWRHTWQVPDVAFRPHPDSDTPAGNMSLGAGLHACESSRVEGKRVALFVAGTPQALCLRDLHALEQQYQPATELPNPSGQSVRAHATAEEQGRPVSGLSRQLLPFSIDGVTPRKRDQVLNELSGDQHTQRATPCAGRRGGGDQQLHETELPQSQHSLIVTSSQRLARAGWQLGPYERLR